MRIAFIGCMVMYREVSKMVSELENHVHPFWIEQGLHDTPEMLKRKLQRTIDEIEEIHEHENTKTKAIKRGYDAIVLGYGLCSNSILGLSSKLLPLVVPRCDDCIAIFLGSYKRYLDLFNTRKGIYWYSRGWMQENHCPSKEYFQKLKYYYIEEYDEDTADYLIEQETGFIKDYENLYFIKSDILSDEKELEISKKIATEFGWKHRIVEGDSSLIYAMLTGNWDERFLVCEKGQRVESDFSDKKIKAETR